MTDIQILYIAVSALIIIILIFSLVYFNMNDTSDGCSNDDYQKSRAYQKTNEYITKSFFDAADEILQEAARHKRNSRK